MEPIHLQTIAQWLNKTVLEDAIVQNVTTDSRTAGEHSLFVAIKGEHFDGNAFIDEVLKTCAGAIGTNPAFCTHPRAICVEDSVLALGTLAREYRSLFSMPVVGVTGSVGKTTTKELIWAVLNQKYKTLKTEGNHNNEIGLPQTLLTLDKTYEAAVVEMGMSGLGEIEYLSQITRPSMGVITTIGVSHLEYLKTRENILKAKMEITAGMRAGAPLFLNADNDLLSTVSDCSQAVIFYGIESEKAQIRAQNIQEEPGGMRFDICYQGNRASAFVPGVGLHFVYNALAAYGVGRHCGLSDEQCLKGLSEYKPSGMRQNMRVMGDITVVEDCYNSSPDSVKAALTTLAGLHVKGRKIAVLGDMLELGSMSEQGHRESGRLAASLKLDALFLFGEQSAYTLQEAKLGGLKDVFYFKDKQSLAQALKAYQRPGDAVWLKASRSMKLEEISKELYGESIK